MSKLSRQPSGSPSATSRTAGSGSAVRRLLGAALIALSATLGFLVMNGWEAAGGTSLPGAPEALVASGNLGDEGTARSPGLTTVGSKAGRATGMQPAQRLQVGQSHAATLRFVCAQSGLDVACTRIVLCAMAEDEVGGEIAKGAGMQLGVPDEHVGKPLTIDVIAVGYAPMRARLSAAAGEHRIALTPSGSVAIRCVDAAGQPVPDVRVALLPPTLPRGAAGLDDYSFDWAALATASADERMAGGGKRPELVLREGVWQLAGVRWQLDSMREVSAAFAGCSDWVQASGKDGMVAWSGVPVAAGYRWGLLPPRIGRVQPEHEQIQYRVEDGRIEVQDPPPYGLSGRFDVTREASSEHLVEVHEPGSVRGFVVAPSGSTPAAVRLYRVVTVAGSGDDVGLMAFEFAATVQTDATQGYRFSFTELAAGSYVVRANWMQHGRDVYFANQAFAVTAGESVDLGGVPPLAQPHGVALHLGVTVDGKQQACRAVYPDVERPMVNLYLEVVPDSRRPEHSVCELMALPLDAEFHFHGLPAGRLIARANAAPGQMFDRATIAKVGRGDFERPLNQIEGSARVDLVATSGVRRALQVVDANGLPLVAPTVWVRRCDALGRCLDAPQNLALHWQQRSGEARLVSELSLPAGDYELACHIAADESGVGMFGRVRARFGPTAQGAGAIQDPAGLQDAGLITLRALPASRASGRAFTPSGEPAEGVLHWRAVTGLEAESHGWPVSARCGEEGAFVLLGIPPGARLIGQGNTPDIDAPQMGLDQVGLRLELTNSTARR